ncbi:DUF1818 family protein [Anthocerotibacter panamensis]|uniref:DUF1818 family protein n=1 Tax=Anthocerotibacter panamensis TaxID=2857077 RepID=UPI001C402EF6|nr:DUF1818 family protein [Anthocerotibacter panamensis]
MKWVRSEGSLVRGPSWCVVLTSEEFTDFKAQARQLLDLLQTVRQELMEDEQLTLECATERLGLYLSGLPGAFSLTLTLYYGRSFEGDWPHPAGQEVLDELLALG